MLATLLYVLVGGFIAIIGVVMGAVLILTAVRTPHEKKAKDKEPTATTSEIEQLVGPGQYKEVTEKRRGKAEEPYVPFPPARTGLTFAEAKAQETSTRSQPARAVAYPPVEKRGQ